MSVWFEIWLGIAGVIGAVWLGRLAGTGQIMRKRVVLSSRSYNGPPPDPPKISVIVAAKDEQDNIETCVRTLLEQDYPNFELIVVDDRSEDETPEILARLQEEHADRLQVLTVTKLRDGWFGKNNAMREGVAASSGEWFLLTDADCRYAARNTLSAAMREALAFEADFLSMTPILDSHAVWEKIVQPTCALALMIWFLPHRVNKPNRTTAYANGAFMLLKRTCYDAIGGHERVRTEVNEDIQMARLTKQMGMRLRVVENEDLYHTRMYDTFAGAWRGWSRIFYGCISSPLRLAASVMLILLACFVPWVSLAVALAGWRVATPENATAWTIAAVAWLVVAVLMQIVMWRIYTLMRAAPAWSLTYLLGAAVTIGMLLSAMLKTLGATGTTWRGTTYRGNRLEDSSPVDTTVAAKPPVAADTTATAEPSVSPAPASTTVSTEPAGHAKSV